MSSLNKDKVMVDEIKLVKMQSYDCIDQIIEVSDNESEALKFCAQASKLVHRITNTDLNWAVFVLLSMLFSEIEIDPTISISDALSQAWEACDREEKTDIFVGYLTLQKLLG